jgi:hypothetical protein
LRLLVVEDDPALHLLVVEDDRALAGLLSRLLRSDRHVVASPTGPARRFDLRQSLR